MRLIDRLHRETAAWHPRIDEELLSGPVSSRSYQRYLARTYGFVAPLERSITTTPGIERYVDLRRFSKQELLRRDLLALRYTSQQIDQLPQCSVPLFNLSSDAMGWAYFVERATLSHSNMFRHVATCIPGDVAFASSYLKCYVGSTADMWRAFGEALDSIALEGDDSIEHVIEGARTAFMFYERWHEPDARDVGEQPPLLRSHSSPTDDETVS